MKKLFGIIGIFLIPSFCMAGVSISGVQLSINGGAVKIGAFPIVAAPCGTPTLIQQATAQGTFSNATTSYALAPTNGNIVIALMAGNGSFAPPTETGVTWVQLSSASVPASSMFQAMYCGTVGPGASATFTSVASGTYMSVMMEEFSHASCTTDGAVVVSTGATQMTHAGSYTPSVSTDLIVTNEAVLSGGASPAGLSAPWTNLAAPDTNGFSNILEAYNLSNNVTPSWDNVFSVPWINIITGLQCAP